MIDSFNVLNCCTLVLSWSGLKTQLNGLCQAVTYPGHQTQKYVGSVCVV